MNHSPRSPLALSLAFVVSTVFAARSASATTYLLDMGICTGTLGGTWGFGVAWPPGSPKAPDVCLVSNLNVAAADTLSIPSGRELRLLGTASNRGDLEVAVGAFLTLDGAATLENRGTVVTGGTFNSYGVVRNLSSGAITNSGYLLNEGEIVNDDDARLTNWRATLDNYGTITNQSRGAEITNITLAFLKNRDGALLEIQAGELTNSDEGTVTAVNGATIQVDDGAAFTNVGLSSTVLIRKNGHFYSEGTFTNTEWAIIDNYGTFETTARLVNAASSSLLNEVGGFVWNGGEFENWSDCTFDNFGAVDQSGTFDNFCDAIVTNEASGTWDGTLDNRGGITNYPTGSWSRAPTTLACKYMP